MRLCTLNTGKARGEPHFPMPSIATLGRVYANATRSSSSTAELLLNPEPPQRPDQPVSPELPSNPPHLAVRHWLMDHGVSLALGLVGVLTAACYAIGRAWQRGWNFEAGVPELSFTWSFQDVVLEGFMGMNTWLGLAAVALALAVYIAFIATLNGWAERRAKQWTLLKARGENLDRVGVRYRFAREAREARLTKVDAQEAVARWRFLGRRGAYRRPVPPDASSSNALTPAWFVLVFCGAVVIVGIGYVVAAYALVATRFNDGRQQFTAEYLAATGHLPPARNLGRVSPVATKASARVEPTPAQFERSKDALKGYRIVRVSVFEDSGGSRPIACGWLVQQAGNQLLFFDESGLHVKTLGDRRFEWDVLDRAQCPRASESEVGGSAAPAAID